MKPARAMLAIVVALLPGSCTNTASLVQLAAEPYDASEPTHSRSEFTYPHSLSAVFAAARIATREAGLSVEEEEPSMRYIVAKHHASNGRWGELVAIYFRATTSMTTSVRIESQPLVITHFGSPDHSQAIFRELTRLLAGRVDVHDGEQNRDDLERESRR